MPVLLSLAQQCKRRRLEDGEARQRQLARECEVLQRKCDCHQAAEGMADQMDRACGRAHDPFQNFDLMRN